MSSADDELRILRERAYGPSADIQDDPAALARLRELELAHEVPDAAPPASSHWVDSPEAHGIDSPEVPAPGRSDDAARPPDEPVMRDDPAGADPEAGDPGAGEASGRTPSRRTRWLWAASVVLALVVGAGLTMATSSLSGNRIAVLGESDASEWPTEMFGDPQEGARIFDAFEGIRVLVVPNAWGSPNSEIVCLFVVRAEEPDGAEVPDEILTTGCGGGAFAPTASFSVTEGSPPGLRERFPVGTGVRVAVEGDEVHVFARTP